MASRAGLSSNPRSSRFPNALVTITPSSHRHSAPTRARLAISARIYWADADREEPASLFDFRDANCLVLSRLADGASWDDVEKIVSALGDDNGRSVVVHGKHHGSARRRILRRNVNAQLTLMAGTPEQAKQWLNEIRMHVVPPDLLHQQFLRGVGSLESTASLDDVSKRLESMFIRNGGLCMEDIDLERADSQAPSHVIDNVSELQEGIEHLNLVDKAAAQTTKLAGSIATAVKIGTQKTAVSGGLASRANQMAQTAQRGAGITGAIAGLSCVFQLVGLGARFVSKLADANHGSRVLPRLLGEVVGYLGVIMACVTEVLHPRMNAEEILVANLFRVLTRAIDAMGGIEEYLMEGKVGQTMDSKLVKEFECEVDELRNVVVNVVQSTNLLKQRLEQETELEQDIGELNTRPMLSPYFVGRTEELNKLNIIVNEHGSAVISQYGGIGKTQLMVKFLENAEASLPGGAYWVTADGDGGKVLDSVSSFAEKLRGSRMTKEDRKDLNIVVAALRKCLSSKNGKWLLCWDNVDNATDPEVSKVLDRVCSIPDPVKRNGWIIVTSRQGRSTLWDGMKVEQRMELGPLSQDDTMCVLTRFANSINANEADDATVISGVYRLKETNRVEFNALAGLSTILGGLPLALVQAGTYIRQFQCTFYEYLKRYEEADGRAEVEELLQRSREFSPVSEEQRATLTTWKISVGRLSRDALGVLRALSMLGNAPMPNRLVKRVLVKSGDAETPVFVKSLLLVQKELVHGTSLVQVEKRGRHVVYDMHRLVRLFVVVAMKVRSDEWNSAFDQAAFSIIECIAHRLKKEGRTIQSLYEFDVFDRQHRTWVSHALATVDHCSRFYSPGNEIRDMIELNPVHQYAGVVLGFFGRYKEQERVRTGNLRILRNHYGSISHPNIAPALGNVASVLRRLGKLKQAQKMQLECLEMQRAIYGHDVNHRSIAVSFGNLGGLYWELGKFDEAETKQRQCLEMERAIYGHGVNYPSIAATLNDLGSIYQARGKLDEAQTTLRACLEMQRAIYGHDVNHPSIANALGNLGIFYEHVGKLDEAEATLRDCFEMQRAIYGKHMNHPSIAKTLGYLGSIHELLGKLDDAETMQRECLETKRAIYGHDVNHPEVATTLNDLASIYINIGKLNEADATLRECLVMQRVIYRDDANHPCIATTLGNLGIIYRMLGKLDEAEKMQCECLEMQRAIFGPEMKHPAICDTLNNLGVLYQSLGKLDDARTKQCECLEIQRAICGHAANHPDIAATLNNLGSTYINLGNLIEAHTTLRECLEMQRAIYKDDENHPSIVDTLCNLGIICKKLGKLDEAETIQRECLEMQYAIYGNDVNNATIANTLNNLGNIYELLGKLDEAETMQRECLEMRRAIYGHGENHPDVAISLYNLGTLLVMCEKVQDGLSMVQDAICMLRLMFGANSEHPYIVQFENSFQTLLNVFASKQSR